MRPVTARKSSESPPRGRLAPSPTGLLHLGHARSFLVAWWHARARGGSVILRLEDLDGPRVLPEFNEAARRDLSWLGLDWDSERTQSEGRERLGAALDDLLSRGLAYACTCSRAEIRAALSAPQQGVPEARYPGTCRGRYTSVADARRRSGKEVGIRLAVEPERILIRDHFAPAQEFDVANTVGDFMIGRRDGTAAYQLAVVLDDAFDGVSEIVRGDDLLPSTARQILLQRAFDLETPSYFHIPLVVDEHGRRLAKRERAVSLASLRERGVDPRAIVRWAADSAGLEPGELTTASECLRAFDMSKVPKTVVTLTRETFAEFGV